MTDEDEEAIQTAKAVLSMTLAELMGSDLVARIKAAHPDDPQAAASLAFDGIVRSLLAGLGVPPGDVEEAMAALNPRETIRMIAVMTEQSLTGAVLVGTAAVSAELREQIGSRLGLAGKARDRFFGRSGPCPDVKQRIEMARALGLLQQQTRDDLAQLVEARNALAHDPGFRSLEDDRVLNGLRPLVRRVLPDRPIDLDTVKRALTMAPMRIRLETAAANSEDEH